MASDIDKAVANLEDEDAGVRGAAVRQAEVEIQLPVDDCARGGSCAAPRYRPLHPQLFGATFLSAWLDADFVAAVEDGSEAALRSILREEVAGRVFSFELLRPFFCDLLLAELENYESSGLPSHRPNTMNNYGLIVNEIGMRLLIDDLQQRWLLPLTRLLFPKEGATFSTHHSFMVQYRQGQDLGLDMHHDDSDVTLNVCLGRQFTGATLSFCGGFGRADHRRHVHTYAHRRGRAILHLGTHRHGADDIASGERYSLIVWSTGAYRETDEYKALARHNLHGTDVPDPICLSYTHDPDYGEYKPYPPGRDAKPESRAAHVARHSPLEAAAKAAGLREGGTTDFKSAAYRAAACKYAAAADYARATGAAALNVGLLSACLLNEAQCRLKLGEFSAAAELCTRTLEQQPDSVKALYRRAVARIAMREHSEAQSDLIAAAKFEPANKAVRAKIHECAQHARAARSTPYRRGVTL